MGVGILIYGLWGVVDSEKNTVEIIKAGAQSSDHSPIAAQGSELKIDVAGAVEQPGVYSLASGSRIGDVLVMAGGLSESADREWVAKMLNLAQEVKDGQKVFVPARETPSQNNSEGVTLKSTLTNINTASVVELDRLEGIGEVRAQAIVDNRPYAETHELVTKAKIPQSVYDKIKDSITIY